MKRILSILLPVLVFWAADLAGAPDARAADAGAPEDIDDIDDIEEVEDVQIVAPDAAENAWTRAYPVLDRVVSLPTALTQRRYTFQVLIEHRTWQSFTDQTFFTGTWWRENLFNAFGFDAGAMKIGLGLRFGILDDLDLGFYRLNQGVLPWDTYELDLKYQPLKQDQHWVNLAVRAGGTWFVQKDLPDDYGAFGQLLADHLFWNRLRIGTGLAFHSNSTAEVKTKEDTDWSLAIPAYLSVRILDWLAWNLEVIANVAGYGADYPNFASSLEFITNRHTFALVLSNFQYLAADGIVANSFRGFGGLVVGFTITRELEFF